MINKMNFRKLRSIVAFVIIAAITSNLHIVIASETDYPAKVLTQIPQEDYSGKVVILHSNDVHGAIDGYAKIAQMKKDYESLGADVIMADAGDFSQGSPYVSSSKGADAIEFMNAAGYDIAAVGNHEFDYEYAKLQENVSSANFVITSANILKGKDRVFTPSSCISTENGLKIGFIGVTTPETSTKTNPKFIKGLTFFSGEEMYNSVQNEIDSLKENNADVIIALAHLGVDEEAAHGKNRSVDLYENTAGLDLIIDGHSHTVMTSYSNGEPIQSTGTKFENIGVVIISKDGNIENNYLISAESLADDQNVVNKTNEIKERIDNLYGQVIAKSEIQFDGTKETNRVRETNSGDIITDAMIWYASRNSDIFEVPLEDVVALENGGAIRDSIPKGDVTKKDLLAVFPFGNTVSVVNVKGSELLELLEASTFNLPDSLGAYPQTAGIKFTVDCTIGYDAGELYPGTTYNRPNSIQRVTIESINGKPFDMNKTYALLTNDFLAVGGDTAYILGEKTAYETGKILDELLEEYIKEELGGVLTAEKYGNSRGDQTLIFDKKSDDTETTEKETKDETAAQMDTGATENIIADDYKGFIDVKWLWCENIVNTLHDLGLVNGRTEESFAPNDNLTRAELVQLLANLSNADLNAYANADVKFADVETNAWYYGAVMWAANNNIVYGMGNDSFAPDISITREDTATIIYRYLGVDAAAENNSFTDTNEISAYASDAVKTLSSEGIINGYPDNTFRPNNTITRAEAASVLYGVNER